MLWRRARRPGPARRSSARPAARRPARPRSRRWPSAITITGRNGPLRPVRPERGDNDRHPEDRAWSHHRHPAARTDLLAAEDRVRDCDCGGDRGARAEPAREQAHQMNYLGIIIALVLAFLAFKFVKGLIKFAILAAILIVALWFLAGG